MKKYLLTGAAILPALYFGVLAFHPGIAYASQSTKKGAPTMTPIAGSYTVDPAHTSIGFEISHLGLSKVQGRFDKVSGHIQADPKNLNNSSVSFTIQADSVDTAVAPRDADLKSANFFDVTNFPEINFVSRHVRKRGAGYLVEGDLTLHGVTKTISIPFREYGPIKDPWGGTRAGIIADPISIDRDTFGMHYDVPMVGAEVKINISLEGTLDKPGNR